MKKLLLTIVGILLIITLVLNVSAEVTNKQVTYLNGQVIIYENVEGYGDVTITIKKINPIEDFFYNLFSVAFTKLNILAGDSVNIRGDAMYLGSPCSGMTFWEIWIVHDGVESSFGRLENQAENIGGCNLQVVVGFGTTQVGTYSLKQKYKWSTSSNYIIEYSTNSLTVSENTDPGCRYQNYEYYDDIPGGGITVSHNTCPEQYPSKFKTRCDSGYKIKDGGGATTAAGIKECVLDTTCIPGWQCDDWHECGSYTPNKQIRVCTDISYCNSDEGKPATERDCTDVDGTNCIAAGGTCYDGNIITGKCPDDKPNWLESVDDCKKGILNSLYCCKSGGTVTCNPNTEELCNGVCVPVGNCGVSGGKSTSMTEEAYNKATNEQIAESTCKTPQDCSQNYIDIIVDETVNVEDWNWTIKCTSSNQIKEINRNAVKEVLAISNGDKPTWVGLVNDLITQRYTDPEKYSLFCETISLPSTIRGIFSFLTGINGCKQTLASIPSGTCRASIKASSQGICWQQANSWLSPYTKSNDCQTNTFILIIGGLALFVMVLKFAG